MKENEAVRCRCSGGHGHTSFLGFCAGMFLLVMTVLTGTAAYATETGLERVRALFDDGRVLHAGMTHELIDSYTGERQVVYGELWISKEKYKIRADQQAVLVDGESSMVYNERQNKLIISEYEPGEDDFAPSRFFSDTDELFRVTDTGSDGDVSWYLLLPDDPFEIFTEVTIYLKPDLTPLRINAVDQMENLLNTSFSDAQYLESSDSIFTLEYPENAEIIDLRK